MLRQTARRALRRGLQEKWTSQASKGLLGTHFEGTPAPTGRQTCMTEDAVHSALQFGSGCYPSSQLTRLAAGFSSGSPFHPQVDVSKAYNGITNEKMEEFLTRQKIVYKLRANGQIVIKECPFCHKPHNNKVSNMWTLNLKENSGAFLCFRCGTHGSWYDFVRHILGDSVNFDKQSSTAQAIGMPVFPNQSMGGRDLFNEHGMLQTQEEEELRHRQEKTSLVVEDMQSAHQTLISSLESLRTLELKEQGGQQLADTDQQETESPSIDLQNLETLRYLISKSDAGARHLSEETLKAFKIGIGSDIFKTEDGRSVSVPTITFPLYRPTIKKGKGENDCNLLDNQNYDCVRSKVRGVGKENKHFQRFKPSGGQIGFFGLNLLRPDCKIVVITEGEFDAMAVFEATGLPAISLPNGASNLPTQLIAYLERVERIYLWMDNDEAGQLNVESFANKLGLKRTYIVQTDLDSRLFSPSQRCQRCPAKRPSAGPKLHRKGVANPLEELGTSSVSPRSGSRTSERL